MTNPHTFSFVDLCGFTSLTEAHGDEDAAAIASKFYAMAEAALVADTRVVKRIGDAVMLRASAPVDCVRTILGLVDAIETEHSFPTFRCGVHAGPAVETGGDYLGAAVNLAARVAAHAQSGEILCTHGVAIELDACGLRAVAVGPTRFKNVPGETALFQIERAPKSAASVTTDPVCRMRVDAARAPARLPYEGRTFSFCSFACAQAFAKDPSSYAR